MIKKLSDYSFVAFLFATVVVILYLFLTIDLDQIRKINSLRRDLTGITEKLSRLSSYNSFLAATDKENLEKNYQKTSFILPNLKDAPGVLQTLDMAASASGITITSLDFAPGKIASESVSSNEILIKANGSGLISQIAQFCGRLLISGRAFSLDNLNLSVNKESSNAASANFSLKAYYLNPPVKDLNPDNPLPKLTAQEEETLSRVLRTNFIPLEIIATTSAKPDLFK